MLSLVESDHVTWILASHWSRVDHAVVKIERLPSVLCPRHQINRDNYKDEIHLVNRSLIRKYLRYGLKTIFLTYNPRKNLKTLAKLL